jgi:competence protein ComEC
MPTIGLIVWLVAILSMWRIDLTLLCLLLVSCLGLSRKLRGRLGMATFVAWLIVGLCCVGSTHLHKQLAQGGALSQLASQDAQVSGELRVKSSPRRHDGQFNDYVSFRATTEWVLGRGTRYNIRAPVLVLAPTSWQDVDLGATITFSGSFQSSKGSDLAGVIRARGDPGVVRKPGWIHSGAESLRAAIRKTVKMADPVSGALLPALVDGDDAGLDEQTIADFRASGLTHLTAVSGANLTLACGALVLVARWVGVRRKGLVLVAVLGIIGFVFLARAEPSVIRAAAMGTAALIGLGHNGRNAGMRAWGIAVTALVLLDPWLALNAGFALSAVATGSILWLAPSWRNALMLWMPRWIAEAIAVPLAAQIGCTPIVAAISGQVSLVAVVANLLAAPVVAPATVLGLVAGLIALIHGGVGTMVARPGVWCCEWLVLVARRSAELPVATIDWSTRPLALALLTGVCISSMFFLPGLLGKWQLATSCAGLLVVVILVPLPTPGWPIRGWALVVCDVAQGDGLVLNTGAGSGVVIDTGPDPRYMDQCLSRLGIKKVPLIILTHFHQDHVGGLEGVFRGRSIGAIEVTTLAEPEGEVRRVSMLAKQQGIAVRTVRLGERVVVGKVSWQVLGPPLVPPADSESPPNDASIVMLVEVSGMRILLTGDAEVPEQRFVESVLKGTTIDVLKVAHHGSAKQDSDLIRGLAPRLALISVGLGNDYGHPAPSTMALLGSGGTVIRRTDLEGDLAVAAGPDGELRVRGRGHPRSKLSQ